MISLPSRSGLFKFILLLAGVALAALLVAQDGL